MTDDDRQLSPEENAHLTRLAELYNELEAEFGLLEKEAKDLRTKVLKALDKEKMARINKFIQEQE